MVTDRYEFCNDRNIVRNFLFWHCVDPLLEHTVCRLRHSHRPRGMAPRKDHAALKYSCRVSRWQPTLAVRSPIQLTVWFGLSCRRKNPGSCRTHPHHGRVGSNRGLYFLACLAFFIQAQCANNERIRFGIGSACWVNSWLDGLAKVRTRGGKWSKLLSLLILTRSKPRDHTESLSSPMPRRAATKRSLCWII